MSVVVAYPRRDHNALSCSDQNAVGEICEPVLDNMVFYLINRRAINMLLISRTGKKFVLVSGLLQDIFVTINEVPLRLGVRCENAVSENLYIPSRLEGDRVPSVAPNVPPVIPEVSEPHEPSNGRGDAHVFNIGGICADD